MQDARYICDGSAQNYLWLCTPMLLMAVRQCFSILAVNKQETTPTLSNNTREMSTEHL